MTDYVAQLDRVMPTALSGSVARMDGTTIATAGFPAPVGAVAEVCRHGGTPFLAEVVGFRDDLTVLFPLSEPNGVRRGDRVRLVRTNRGLRVGPELLGRVIDAEGRTIDGFPRPALRDRAALDNRPPTPCERPRIDRPLCTGVRSIDGMLTCGKGQRMGIFAGSGLGKSVLLGMMARYTDADVIIISLIGERGREVNEFIQRDLGPDGLAKSVVVVATSNEPAVVRAQAASTAVSVAEYFRDQGKDVFAAYGFADPVRPGPARDRSGGRRAAGDARISAVGFRAAAEAGRASRPFQARQHNGFLCRAGRSRRS